MITEKMREEFEAMVLATKGNNGMLCDLVRNLDGEYRSSCERSAWWAWQASRAAIELELPELAEPFERELTGKPLFTLEGEGRNKAIYEFSKSIESLGLKVKP